MGIKPEEIEVIAERIPQWDFLNQLPEKIGDFTWKKDGSRKGHILTFGAYQDKSGRRRLEIAYTTETWDYLIFKQIGLLRFRDLRFITRDRDKFAREVSERIEALVGEVSEGASPRCRGALLKKGITDWDFAKELPQRIGRFELFLNADNAFEFINNSLAFVHYADFETKSHLTFFYNRGRREFFAEKILRGVPFTIHDFDAKDLAELEGLIKDHLESYLLSMGEELEQKGRR